MEAIYIKRSNCRRITGLYLKDKTVQKMITQFVLNAVFHRVSLSWLISSNKHVKYDIEENNYDWLNKGPWYNTEICSKSYGTVFEDYLRCDRTDI